MISLIYVLMLRKKKNEHAKTPRRQEKSLVIFSLCALNMSK